MVRGVRQCSDGRLDDRCVHVSVSGCHRLPASYRMDRAGIHIILRPAHKCLCDLSVSLAVEGVEAESKLKRAELSSHGLMQRNLFTKEVCTTQNFQLCILAGAYGKVSMLTKSNSRYDNLPGGPSF